MYDRPWQRKSLICTIVLLCLSIDLSVSQDFTDSDNVDIWIQRCTLKVKWTSEYTVDGCILHTYRVQLYRNDIEIATLDTAALKYSNDGIDSESFYRVEITPILRCSNNSDIYRRKRVKTISAIPDIQKDYVIKNISENVALECPLTGAYQPFNVTWQHMMGISATIVRIFTTELVNLQSVTYRDMGQYNCSVKYNLCGASKLQRESSSSVTLSVNGPPLISSSQQTFSISPGENVTFDLKVISFPAPNSKVVIKNQRRKDIFRKMVSFKTVLTPLEAYRKTVKVEGYNAKFSLLNISEDWFGTNNIIVSNRFGNHSIKIVFKNFSYKENNNFFEKFLKENTILLAGVGAGILILFFIVIVMVITLDIRRKRRRNKMELNGNHNQHEEAETSTVVTSNNERIYARPFAFGNNDEGQASAEVQRLTDREKQIELERRQCASMYSYGGFSVNEFQDDEIMYDNQFAPEYK